MPHINVLCVTNDKLLKHVKNDLVSIKSPTFLSLFSLFMFIFCLVFTYSSLACCVIQRLRFIKKEPEDQQEKAINDKESKPFEEPKAERVKVERLPPGGSYSPKHTDSEQVIHTHTYPQ